MACAERSVEKLPCDCMLWSGDPTDGASYHETGPQASASIRTILMTCILVDLIRMNLLILRGRFQRGGGATLKFLF